MKNQSNRTGHGVRSKLYEDQLLWLACRFLRAYVPVKDLSWSDQTQVNIRPSLPRVIKENFPWKQNNIRRKCLALNADLNAYDVIYYAGQFLMLAAKPFAIYLPNDEAVQVQKGTRRLPT